MAHALEKLFGGGVPGGGNRAARAALVAIALIALLAILLNLGDLGAAMDELGLYLGYGFIRRALGVGALVALCAALLGVTLVLKRYSMIGDGLSHVGFGALSVASALGFVTAESLPGFLPAGLRGGVAALCGKIAAHPLQFALVVVIALAFLILRINGRRGMRGDAAIALLSTSALAVGVVAASLSSGMNVDVMNYMFGSILALSESDVAVSVALAVAVIALYALFNNRIFAVTFDEPFARATGTRVGSCDLLISLLTAVTIVTGMRLMGTMLISSLIIFPALTAMRLYARFRPVLICSAVVSVTCFTAGILLSCLWAMPAGAAIVLTNLAAFALCALIARARG